MSAHLARLHLEDALEHLAIHDRRAEHEHGGDLLRVALLATWRAHRVLAHMVMEQRRERER